MAKTGKLSVNIRSDSGFFGSDVPVEIRDSQMHLVKKSQNERLFPLPVGLYEVSAVLEDGRRYKQLVQIKDQETVPVELGFSEQDQAPESSSQADPFAIPSYERPRYTQKIESITDTGTESKTGSTARVIEVNGALLKREAGLLWVFECKEDQLNFVPNAIIQIGAQKIQISLPISPNSDFPYNSCVVKVEETRNGTHADAWISKERTVANALQNMLASGYVLRAADVANDAVDLLRYKYSDPTGAALGALILYKVGRLERWRSWVENLANDFDWLPDGKVMLATLLYNDASSRDRALELAIRASSQRMLFAESYSLLLDLLRRWPGDLDREERRRATSKLALLAPYIDWESICLNQAVVDGDNV